MSLHKKKKTEGLTPEEEVDKQNFVKNTLKVIVVRFVTTLKGSKLLMKKVMMLSLKNSDKYNVKKVYMGEA